MRYWLPALILLCTSSATAATAPAYAIVVGNNTSDDPKVAALRYADDDAINYALLLEEMGVETYLLVTPDKATHDIYPLLKPYGEPSQSNIGSSIDQINKKISLSSAKDSILYFFYAGHGNIRNGEGYINLSDGTLGRRDFFETVVKTAKAHRKHIVIDACKSYFMVFERGEDEPDRLPYNQPFDDQSELSKYPNTGFFLSTSSAKNSHEWEEFQAGIFSHEIRSGLRGPADLNMDGAISYSELAAFVYTANKSIVNEKYRPNFIAVPPVADDIFLAVSHQGVKLVLDSNRRDHFYVENSKGIRLLDVRPGSPKAYTWLPRRTKLFVRNVDSNREYIVRRQKRNPLLLSSLTVAAPRTSTRGAAHEAFSSLFDEPFDLQSYSETRRSKVVWQRSTSVVPEKDVYTPSPWIFAGLGSAAMFASVGGVLIVLGNMQFERYKEASYQEQPAIRENGERLDLLAVVTFSTAGILAGTTFAVQILGLLEEADAKDEGPVL